jgi:hypothetical protein
MVLCINIWSDGHRFLSSITPHPSFSKSYETSRPCLSACLLKKKNDDYVDVALFPVFETPQYLNYGSAIEIRTLRMAFLDGKFTRKPIIHMSYVQKLAVYRRMRLLGQKLTYKFVSDLPLCSSSLHSILAFPNIERSSKYPLLPKADRANWMSVPRFQSRAVVTMRARTDAAFRTYILRTYVWSEQLFEETAETINVRSARA